MGELRWVWFLLPSIIVFISQPTADPVAATSSSLVQHATSLLQIAGDAPPHILFDPVSLFNLRRCDISGHSALNPAAAAFFPPGLAPHTSGSPLTTARPNTSPASGFIPHGPSPTRPGGLTQPLIHRWQAALQLYPDREFLSILFKILRNGASLGVAELQRNIRVAPYRLGKRELDFLREETTRRLAAGEVQVVHPSCTPFTTFAH